jgi:hypothetical protein
MCSMVKQGRGRLSRAGTGMVKAVGMGMSSVGSQAGARVVLAWYWARLVSLTVVLWLIAATIVPSFLGWFLTPHFHGSFSVGHCSGNCLFHWVFCDFGPLLSVLENSGSKCRFS